MLIIVDPDTPAETAEPKYIENPEAEGIAEWVRNGGKLVLLGNDKGNAEFEHLNQLAGRFGIEFLEETYPKVKGKGILVASGDHPIFAGGLHVYLVEVAPLKLSGACHLRQGQGIRGGRPLDLERIHRSQRQPADCHQAIPAFASAVTTTRGHDDETGSGRDCGSSLWGMAGENQSFEDTDRVDLTALR